MLSPLKLALRRIKIEPEQPKKSSKYDYLSSAMSDFSSAKSDDERARAFKAALRLASIDNDDNE